MVEQNISDRRFCIWRNIKGVMCCWNQTKQLWTCINVCLNQELERKRSYTSKEEHPMKLLHDKTHTKT